MDIKPNQYEILGTKLEPRCMLLLEFYNCLHALFLGDNEVYEKI